MLIANMCMNAYLFKILGFYRDISEAFALVGSYTMYVGSCLLTFRDSL
jgi:hypothetical protein